jgi:hypothetical protein
MSPLRSGDGQAVNDCAHNKRPPRIHVIPTGVHWGRARHNKCLSMLQVNRQHLRMHKGDAIVHGVAMLFRYAILQLEHHGHPQLRRKMLKEGAGRKIQKEKNGVGQTSRNSKNYKRGHKT